MAILPRLVLSAVCLGILFFSGFGFLATFEPLGRSVQLTKRVVYSIVSIPAITGIVFLHRPRKRTDREESRDRTTWWMTVHGDEFHLRDDHSPKSP